MVLDTPRDCLEYAMMHARVGNYEGAIDRIKTAIDKEIQANPQYKMEIYKKAGDSFLKLAQRFDKSSQRWLAKKSLFNARVYYQHAKIIVPSLIDENWEAYLYSKRDDISLEVFDRKALKGA